MDARDLTYPTAGAEPAAQILPQPLTPEKPRADRGAMTGTRDPLAADPARPANDVGSIEYASWIRLLQRNAA